MKKKLVFSLGLFFLLSLFVGLPSVLAAEHIPIGLQKIIDYNKANTTSFALKITFFVAFLAGTLSILSPCVLPLLPAYLSYTFKERKNITFMTLIFAAGFTTSFVIMGVIAGFLGEQVLLAVQTGPVTLIAGVFIASLGTLTLLGKGFSSFLQGPKKFKNDIIGTFLFGVFFALGWTACLGPVLAGILGIGAILGNTAHSALLLLFYSLGTLVPLFVFSVFYDRTKIYRSSWLRKEVSLKFFNKNYSVHRYNLLSGSLLIIVGFTIVIFQGTGVVNTWDLFGTRQYFYTTQKALMEWEGAQLVGIVAFVLMIIIVSYSVWKQRVNR